MLTPAAAAAATMASLMSSSLPLFTLGLSPSSSSPLAAAALALMNLGQQFFRGQQTPRAMWMPQLMTGFSFSIVNVVTETFGYSVTTVLIGYCDYHPVT